MRTQRGYAQLIMLGLVVGLVAGGLFYVYREGHDAGYAEAMFEIREIEQEQKKQEAGASAALEADRSGIDAAFDAIDQEIFNAAQNLAARECLDPASLRLANAALAGALVPAGKPDRRVPAAAPAR